MSEGTVAQVLAGEAAWCVVTGEACDVMKLLPAKSVDLVHADPPYSEHTHSKSRAGSRKVPLKDGNGRISKCAISREVDFGFASITQDEREAMGDEFARITRGWVLVFCDVESSHLWAGALRSAGLDYCRTGAWIKIGATPQFTGDRPGVGFEAIVICHPKGRKRWNGGGSHAVWTHLTCIERGGKSSSNDSREHPTQKPLPLAVELTGLFSNVGGLVLDPTCGSGTHGAAAVRMGRRFIGVERNADFAENSRRRLRAEQAGSSVAAVKAGQGALFG